jgi:RNA polymerase sigma factor (sigma-70 family)
MLPEFKEWEDLEQEGSIALLTAIERFDPNRRVQFPTFAIRCIRTRYGKYLDKTNRRSRRQTSLYNEEGESMDLELLCGSTSSPEDVVVFNDACRFIREQVELLPSHLSEVLLKRYWEHKTHKQIAQELNRTASGMCQREKTSHSILRTKIPEDIFSR